MAIYQRHLTTLAPVNPSTSALPPYLKNIYAIDYIMTNIKEQHAAL